MAAAFGFYDAVILFVILSAIPLAASLIVGLVVSVFQAATQIQEQTLTFVPKLVAVVVALCVAGPWMVHQAVTYCEGILNGIASGAG